MSFVLVLWRKLWVAKGGENGKDERGRKREWTNSFSEGEERWDEGFVTDGHMGSREREEEGV